MKGWRGWGEDGTVGAGTGGDIGEGGGKDGWKVGEWVRGEGVGCWSMLSGWVQ